MTPRTPGRHPLLARQIQRTLLRAGVEMPPAGEAFLAAVNDAYVEYDRERALMEHSLAALSDELSEQLQRVRASMSLVSATLEATGDGIIVIDPGGTVTSINKRVAAIFGLGPHAHVGLSQEALLAVAGPLFSDPDGTRQLVQRMAEQPEAEHSGLMELVDGRVLEVSSRPQRLGDAIVGRVWCFRDVTQRVDLERRLAHQAYHDALTGLPNRARFRQRAEEMLDRHRTRRETITILLLDLDGFKAVNDTLGHAAGDALLVQVAERLLNATRGCDMVARLGGDEFAVLLGNVRNAKDVNIVADRIIHALRTPFYLGSAPVQVGTSIGIARGDSADDAVSAQAAAGEQAQPMSPYDLVLQHADLALYLVKSEGRGRFAHFDPSLHSAYLERRTMERALRTALEDGTLELAYQTIHQLGDHQVVGFEALVRWHDPMRGLVPPARFLPIAEESGLILPLGRWVLSEACRQQAEWARQHPEMQPCSICVNVSGRQLRDQDFVATVQTALHASGLAPEHLILELTESTVVDQPEFSLARMQALRALGVRLALDDFGTGYSALRYLQHFPIDMLKIDKTFVDAVTRGGSYAALTSALIALGNAMSLTTIAEGVETPEQLAALRAMGCTQGQGFLFRQPVAAAQIPAVLREAALAHGPAA